MASRISQKPVYQAVMMKNYREMLLKLFSSILILDGNNKTKVNTQDLTTELDF